ncbi:MAG: hypothetical protein Q4E57_09395 [Eubacteriales bacterium]|nr:hypothetical protein [Eubacteriales bacterium]
MTNYELYCAIFLAFDADWDETHNEGLREYLSDANPFLFEGENSADPAIYAEFCKFMSEYKLTVENSFEIAQKYVEHLQNADLKESFDLLEEEQWYEVLPQLLEEMRK